MVPALVPCLDPALHALTSGKVFLDPEQLRETSSLLQRAGCFLAAVDESEGSRFLAMAKKAHATLSSRPWLLILPGLPALVNDLSAILGSPAPATSPTPASSPAPESSPVPALALDLMPADLLLTQEGLAEVDSFPVQLLYKDGSADPVSILLLTQEGLAASDSVHDSLMTKDGSAESVPVLLLTLVGFSSPGI